MTAPHTIHDVLKRTSKNPLYIVGVPALVLACVIFPVLPFVFGLLFIHDRAVGTAPLADAPLARPRN